MVDLDGTLASYDGWRGEASIGDPIPGAVEAMERLIQEFDVYVYTVRQEKGFVAQWLQEHGFPAKIQVFSGDKPMAWAYIDDRAFRFEGDWAATLKQVQEE
jgi:hypothetical protein